MTRTSAQTDRARAKFDAGDYASATLLLLRIVASDPDDAEARYLLGRAHLAAARIEPGLKALRRAISVQPDLVCAWDAIGQVCFTLKRYEEAEEAFRRCVDLGGDTDASLWLGAIRADSGRNEEAIDLYEAHLLVRPSDRIALERLAIAYRAANQPGEARQLLENLIRSDPANARLLSLLALLCLETRDFDAGRRAALRAIEAEPGRTAAHQALHAIALERLDLDDAVQALTTLHALEPDNRTTEYQLWNLLLLSGRYLEGWECYERWMAHGEYRPRQLGAPRWNGRDLNGKTLLVYADHGYGDGVQCLRYLPLVKERSRSNVILEAPVEMASLWRSVAGVDRVVERRADLGAPECDFDYRIGLLSLPGLFRSTPDSIPADVPYLAPSLEARERWRALLRDIPGLRVGVRWAGDPAHGNDAARSTRLADFAPLARIPNVSLISLQKDESVRQAGGRPADILCYDFSSGLKDFEDTAALLMELDLVITVDTAVAHLAGALALPTWLLLPYLPDWRWLLSRPSDTPWYPTMRLFRQSTAGDWSAPIARASRELSERATRPELASESDQA